MIYCHRGPMTSAGVLKNPADGGEVDHFIHVQILHVPIHKNIEYTLKTTVALLQHSFV